ncbi:hypothetical protein CH63R_14598 [Colletotrichum higginsianum IMI 349063]|uniref:Uncharacterized protein n=1 Tax=Colletotrichum higginsianum (strain IMI 349063) TaxID=759273 RepID=A0A1B7XQI0_COLHI|nr:hypothetical protein CH63R_14598 [Colletotrichum higginsianum IMI 349063]OBR02026.1 hypothetical protein CH63R_14598 [Colletotrichum higginsianum IMI 349063]
MRQDNFSERQRAPPPRHLPPPRPAQQELWRDLRDREGVTRDLGQATPAVHAFARDFAAAKAKPDGTARMRNAQAALDLAAPVDLLLVLGPAVCSSTGSLKAISSLRNAKGHEPVDADTITAAIRTKMLARHMLLPAPDHVAPVPKVADVTEAVKHKCNQPSLQQAVFYTSQHKKEILATTFKNMEQHDLEDEASRANISSSGRSSRSSRSRSNKRRRTSRLSSDEVDELGRHALDDAMEDEAPSFLASITEHYQGDIDDADGRRHPNRLPSVPLPPSPPSSKAALETAENAAKTALTVAAGDYTVKSIAETSQWRQSRAGRGGEEEEEEDE